MPVMVDGEPMQDEEVLDLIRMFNHDCKEFAGAFFDNDRSDKFRKSWNEVGQLRKKSPQDCFVDHAWKHFAVHVRTWYSARLTDEKEAPENKSRMHKALILQYIMGQVSTAENPVQLSPGTQQFEGDKFENRNISATYGDQALSLKETLLGSTATKH